MARTEIARDLACRRAEAEIAKLEAEAARARRERRGIGARVGVVVSVATALTSLVIGGSQVWLAHRKDQNDRRLREVGLGLKTAEFVLAKQGIVLAVSADGQRAFVGLVVDILPPLGRAPRAPDPCADLREPTERERRVFSHVARDRDRVLLLEHPRALAALPRPIAPIETAALAASPARDPLERRRRVRGAALRPGPTSGTSR